jgi:hypothetical protein
METAWNPGQKSKLPNAIIDSNENDLEELPEGEKNQKNNNKKLKTENKATLAFNNKTENEADYQRPWESGSHWGMQETTRGECERASIGIWSDCRLMMSESCTFVNSCTHGGTLVCKDSCKILYTSSVTVLIFQCLPSSYLLDNLFAFQLPSMLLCLPVTCLSIHWYISQEE